jgi:hypothetical protein
MGFNSAFKQLKFDISGIKMADDKYHALLYTVINRCTATEVPDLPERDVVSLGEWFPPIRGALLPSSVTSCSPEDEGTTNIKKSVTIPPNKTASHPGRL